MRQLKQNWGFLLSAFAFAIVIYLLWGKQVEGTLALGIIGTIVSLYFGVLKYKMENDRMFNELFTNFTKRYDETLNDLINQIRFDPEKTLSIDEKKLLIDYINLCAEEYLWYSKNRIPEKVWQAWKAGILANLEVSQVKQVYLNEIDSEHIRKSLYGLVEELKIYN
jgi:hypothetical protein